MKTIEQVKEFLNIKLSRSLGKIDFYITKNDIINIEYYEHLKNFCIEILDYIDSEEK